MRGVLKADRRSTTFDVKGRSARIGACIVDAVTLVAFIGSIYLAGRLAQRRGRSFKIWAWIAAFIGPLALPLVFLFPNLHGKTGNV